MQKIQYPTLSVSMHPIRDLPLYEYIVAEAQREHKTKARYLRDLLHAVLAEHLPPTDVNQISFKHK